MNHKGRYAGPECPVCGPLVKAAQDANAEWTRQQCGRRGTKAYAKAHDAVRAASAAMLAAKNDHYKEYA